MRYLIVEDLLNKIQQERLLTDKRLSIKISGLGYIDKTDVTPNLLQISFNKSLDVFEISREKLNEVLELQVDCICDLYINSKIYKTVARFITKRDCKLPEVNHRVIIY